MLRNQKHLFGLTLISWVAFLEMAAVQVVAAAEHMYWSEWNSGAGRIVRANLDATHPETVITINGGANVEDLDLDLVRGKIYWTSRSREGTRKPGRVLRANLDGSGVEEVVTELGTLVFGLKLDLTGGKIYWGDRSNHKIQRANLNGSDVEDVVTGVRFPLRFDIDPLRKKLYWADLDADRPTKIQRANLDGSDVEDVLTTAFAMRALAVDVTGEQVYWSGRPGRREPYTLSRARLDGTKMEDLPITFPEVTEIEDIAIDASSGHLYWADDYINPVKIQRANLDGTELTTLVEDGEANSIVLSVGSGIEGDLNGNWQLDTGDLDIFGEAVVTDHNLFRVDLNDDGQFSEADRIFWIRNISNTYFGDSNLDGEFNTNDLVTVFQAGQYEDAVEGNSSWETGDWNGDGDFGTADLVLAFQDGGFEQGPRAGVAAAVPEPGSVLLLLLGGALMLRRCRRQWN